MSDYLGFDGAIAIVPDPSVQQVAFLDTETDETGERRLSHSDGEAERFYRDLQRRQVKVRVGIEATGHARWFERLLAELKSKSPPTDWASRSLSREFEVVIMVERAIGEMVGSDRIPPERLHANLSRR